MLFIFFICVSFILLVTYYVFFFLLRFSFGTLQNKNKKQTGSGTHAADGRDASLAPSRRQVAKRPLPPVGSVDSQHASVPPQQITTTQLWAFFRFFFLHSKNKDIVEVKIGYDGITMSTAKSSALKGLTRQQVYLALAKEVPDPTNTTTLIPNPYKKWKDIDKSLPDVKIEVLGPPPTSGTRDSFAELYLESGCSNYAWIKSMKDVDEKRYKRICDSIREDGAYIEAGENDNLVVQKLQSNPTSVGIFGFSYLAENQSKIRGLSIDGVDPTFETVASAKYVTSRPLFIYVKKAHIGTIPGIKEFMEEYVSDKALGSEGYLSDRGLVPLDKSALNKTKAGVKSLKNFSP